MKNSSMSVHIRIQRAWGFTVPGNPDIAALAFIIILVTLPVEAALASREQGSKKCRLLDTFFGAVLAFEA